MNREEALSVLSTCLEAYRRQPYAELAGKLGNQGCDELVGPSGATYQIEIDIVRDAGTDLRVIGSVDDGAWRSFAPLSESFIIGADGTVR